MQEDIAKAEVVRRSAEERYRILVERLSAVVYLARCDAVSPPLYMGPSVEALTGYAAADFLAQPDLWHQILHPDDRDRVTAERLRANVTGEPFRVEYRIVARDGRIVWIQDEAALLTDEDGDRLWQGVWVDITDRKETEQALRASERRYRDLVEHSEGLILTHDLDGVVRSVNPAVARGLGCRTQDLLGTDLRRYLTPAARAAFGVYLEQIRREPIASGQLEVVTCDGDERIWSYRNVRYEEPGQPPYVIAHAHDITDRYRAESALRTSEARVRQLLASEQRKSRELNLLGQVRQALADELDLSALIRTVVQGVQDTFGYPLVSLYLIEDGELRLQHQVGYPRVIERIALDRGVVGKVARTGEPVLVPDASTEPDFLRAFDGIAAEVCVPLKVSGEMVGILSLESTMVGGLGEDDLRLMLALADNVNVALGRIRLGAALRASEERFRTAFDAAPIGMVLLDPKLRPLRVNRAFGAMLGYADGITEAEVAAVAIHQDDRSAMREALRRLVAGVVPVVERECRYRHLDGREIRGQVSASLVRNDDGNPVSVILQIQDVTERLALAEELRRLAMHDQLTGLANRTQFLERLTVALLDPPVDGDPSPIVAVLYLDLDGFKSVNDRFGHEVGDELLAVVGRRLAADVRDGDVVARFGGDEFTVLLRQVTGAVEAHAVAERLVAALNDPITLERGETVGVGACAGVALGLRGQTNPSDLLRDADAALYRAKASGKGGIGIFDSVADEVVSRP